MKRKAPTPRRNARQKDNKIVCHHEAETFDVLPDLLRCIYKPIEPIAVPEIMGIITAFLRENGHMCMMIDHHANEPTFLWCQKDKCAWMPALMMREGTPDKNDELSD